MFFALTRPMHEYGTLKKDYKIIVGNKERSNRPVYTICLSGIVLTVYTVIKQRVANVAFKLLNYKYLYK